MRNPELWARLSAYEFDGVGSAPFSAKLAEAEGWSATFTTEVLEEYRRFLYLTQMGDAQVTLSKVVDAAWHLHLSFTRDYWDVLCGEVIGAPMHHQPCAGEEEMPRYREQFAATRALYEAEFEEQPPTAIWGHDAQTVGERLVRASGTSRINSDSLIVVALVGCVGINFTGLDVHWLVYVAILGAAYWLGSVLDRANGRRTRRKDEDWMNIEVGGGGRGRRDGDGDGDAGGCGGCGD